MELPSYEQFIADRNKRRATQLAAGASSGTSRTAAAQKADPMDDLLSVAESKSLGVPYGTTKRQAAAMNINPATKTPQTTQTAAQTKASPAQITQLSDAETTVQSANDILGIVNNKNNNKLVDTGRSQKLKGFLRKNFGTNIYGLKQSNEEQKLQYAISNLSANYRKFLSGVAVSDKEREYLERTLLPNITDTRQEIQNKLNQLNNYVTNYKGNLSRNIKSFNQTNTQNTGDEIDQFLASF